MSQLRLLWLVVLACMVVSGCDRTRRKKPDPTKGSVSGTVICSDTDKPARFATVTLVEIPRKDEKTDRSAAVERSITDLNGQFDLEAVEPGRYYAFADLAGYLSPEMSLDFERVKAISGDHAQLLDSIQQWKSHLVEVTVRVQRASSITIPIDRAAEIHGTVTYDDGTPAIGMHFMALRRSDKDGWSKVGLRLLGEWSLEDVSDSRGRYSIVGLPAGEYIVCALLPVDDEDTATTVCLGNTMRPMSASPVKVETGEVVSGQDIVIPLTGMHTVSGTVTVLVDGHSPSRALVHLLYADDRKQMRKTSIDEDGSFSFSFVPEGHYILEVTSAADKPETDSDGKGVADPSAAHAERLYADKTIPLNVLGDLEDQAIQLVPLVKDISQKK